MKSRKKIIFISLGLVLLLAGGLLTKYLLSVNSYHNKIKVMEFSNIDTSLIPDGTYVGECDVDFIYAKVQVMVSNGKISDVKLLEHKTDRGKPAETITREMVEQNTLDVDAVSGATNSSKVIRKAAENALLTKR